MTIWKSETTPLTVEWSPEFDSFFVWLDRDKMSGGIVDSFSYGLFRSLKRAKKLAVKRAQKIEKEIESWK